MNIRWTLVLSVIALAVLGWFYSLQQEDAQLTELIKAPDSPEYVGQNMQTTMYSPTGKPQYLASAIKVEHFTNDGRTEFAQPVVVLLDLEVSQKGVKKAEGEQAAEQSAEQATNKTTENWKLSADKAKLTKDNMLYLEGNVVAQSLSPMSRLKRIETESALVNLKTQDISSDKMVKINGQNFSSTGLKLVGNLHQQVATLKEQVKTFYEISQ